MADWGKGLQIVKGSCEISSCVPANKLSLPCKTASGCLRQRIHPTAKFAFATGRASGEKLCSRNPVSSMEGRLKYGQGRTRGTPWAASLALEKHKSEGSGRTAFHNEWTDEDSVLNVRQRSRLCIGSVNVGTI